MRNPYLPVNVKVCPEHNLTATQDLCYHCLFLKKMGEGYFCVKGPWRVLETGMTRWTASDLMMKDLADDPPEKREGDLANGCDC